jgi:hypothetical protein
VVRRVKNSSAAAFKGSNHKLQNKSLTVTAAAALLVKALLE